MAYLCVVCEKTETVKSGSACPDCLHENLLRVQHPCERCGRSYYRTGGDKGRCGACHLDKGGEKPWVETVEKGGSGWLLYVLRCDDDSLYCGITNDLPRRLHAHNAGKAAKYTRPKARRPVHVVYTNPYPDRASASKAEYTFKQLYKSQKEAVVHAHATARKHRN